MRLCYTVVIPYVTSIDCDDGDVTGLLVSARVAGDHLSATLSKDQAIRD